MAEVLAYENNPDTKETERFVHTFDKFFDLMNVRSLKEGVHKCKPNLLPYRNNSQSRDHLQVSITYLIAFYYLGIYKYLLLVVARERLH